MLKKNTGRPRRALPAGVRANAFAKWLAKTKTRPEDVARALAVRLATVYGWRRGRPPGRAMAARIETLTGGAVKAGGWD